MNDNIEIKAILIFFLALIASVSGCSVHQGNIAERLVREGNDPIKVRCMLNGFSGDANVTICMEAAKK